MSFTKYFVMFAVMQLMHIICFALLGLSQVSGFALVVSGIISIFTYGWLGYREFKSGSGFSPILFYIAASAMRLGIATVYAGYLVLMGEGLYLSSFDGTNWAMEGHLLLLSGDIFFIGGYYLMLGTFAKKMACSYDVSKSAGTYRAGAILATLSLGLNVADFAGLPLSKFGQFTASLVDYGVAAGTYMMLRQEVMFRRRWLSATAFSAYLIISLNVTVGLLSYMKSALFVAIMPFLLIWAERLRDHLRAGKLLSGVRMTLPILALAWIFIFVVGVYSQLRRAAFEFDQGGRVQAEYAVAILPYLDRAIYAGVPGTEEFREFNRLPLNQTQVGPSGVWAMLQRLCVTPLGAWAYQRVETEGKWDRSFFGDFLVAVTPRIMWPDKPQVWPSRLLSVELGMAKDAESSVSATGLTMAGAYYWWGGAAGMVIGLLVSGSVMGMVWCYVGTRWEINPVAMLVAMALFFQCLHWWEGAFFGGLPFYLYLVIVYFPMIWILDKVYGIRNYRSTCHSEFTTKPGLP